jgi:release factor glutamine methyltransferase
MNLENTLLKAIEELNSHNIKEPQIEAIILLGHVLNLSKEQIYTNPCTNLDPNANEAFQRLIARRILGEPAAYILNHKEFFGLDFFVDQRVLIPRPETELLVEEILKLSKDKLNTVSDSNKTIFVADVGTGCGNIAISLALNNVNLKIFATDISSSSLEVARINCDRHNVGEQVILLQGKYLEPITSPIDFVVANLPYIERAEIQRLQPEIVHFEPHLALDGGIDGLDHITELLTQLSKRNAKPRFIILEIGAGQTQLISSLISSLLPESNFEFISDLNDIKRVVKIEIKHPEI